MPIVFAYAGRVLLMLVLLLCSGFLSGSETAFFSLSPRQINSLKHSRRRLSRMTAHLLTRANTLLGALLLGNLIVNTLFFAASSVLMVDIGQRFGLTTAAVVALVTFFTLVLFGEIFPKSLAYINPRRVTALAALPAHFLLRILGPIVTILNYLVAGPALRLLLGPYTTPKAITSDEFKALIDVTGKRGLITSHQKRLLMETVDFGALKVRHVMRPRVDLSACTTHEPLAAVRERMIRKQMTHLLVYEHRLDNIKGMIQLRDILLRPDREVKSLMRKVHFVPEQKSVESLLQFFRKMRTETAVVVDEYGGLAGSVSVEDVAGALLVPIQPNGGPAPITQVGPFQYRLSGNLPIHEWMTAFGIKSLDSDIVTVGGFVTALLGKIPAKNDEVRWHHVHFKVEQVNRHRIRNLILTIGRPHA